MIYLRDDESFDSAILSDRALSQDEPETELELSRVVTQKFEFALDLRCEEAEVRMYADRELLADLRAAIDAALGDR